MFWWTHGIFISVLLLTIVLVIIKEMSHEVNNLFIDRLVDFAYDLIDNAPFIVLDIGLGALSPFVYYYMILLMKDTYTLNLVTLAYNVKSLDLLSEDLQALATEKVNEYMAPIWNNYYLGFEICVYIVLGFIAIVLVGSLIAFIVNKGKNDQQTNIQKIRYAYMVAEESKSPEMQEVAKVLKKTLKKLELQKEMDKVSDGLKAARSVQGGIKTSDVQKDLDTILAMMQLDEDEVSVLTKKYDKLSK